MYGGRGGQVSKPWYCITGGGGGGGRGRGRGQSMCNLRSQIRGDWGGGRCLISMPLGIASQVCTGGAGGRGAVYM